MQIKCLVTITEEQDKMGSERTDNDGGGGTLYISDQEQARKERIYYILLITILTVNILATLPLCELCRFHLMLRRLGISTFEYLKQQENIHYKSKVTVKI